MRPAKASLPRLLVLSAMVSSPLGACKKTEVAKVKDDEFQFEVDGHGNGSAGGSDTVLTLDMSGEATSYHGMQVEEKLDGSTVVMNDLPSATDGITDPNGGGQEMAALHLTVNDGKKVPANAVPDYIKSCQQAGVPIPPQWGSDQWLHIGDMDQEYVFAAQPLPAQLWAYKAMQPLGICAAMARTNMDRVARFGVICHSLTNGATCFWDNIGPDTRQTVPVPSGGPNEGYTVSMGSGANLLTENCLGCHRGTTPWIRVAGQPTQGLAYRKEGWTPLALGRPDWVPQAGSNVPGCSAGACHAMPKLEKAYCTLAWQLITKKVMPPPSIKDAARKAMADKFVAACKAAGVGK